MGIADDERMDSNLQRAHKRIRELEAELFKAKDGKAIWIHNYSVATELCEQLKADNTRLRSCLKRLEWCVVEDYCTGKFCPVCSAWKMAGQGHAPDCWLAAECKEGK